MIVRVDDDLRVTLDEPEDLKGFKVVAPEGADVGAALQGALAGIVSADGGAHLLVAWVRQQALAAGAGDGWEADFEAMLAFAASRGWVDPTGTSIQAHIERTTTI